MSALPQIVTISIPGLQGPPGPSPTIVSGTGITASTSGNTTTLNLGTSGVTAGSYTNSSLTVDAYGRVTSATSGATNTLAAGTGLSISTSGSTTTIGLTSTNTLVAGTGISITTSGGTTTVANSGVTSVSTSSTTSGLSLTTATATTTPAITLSGTLNIANGGTGQTTAAAAYNALSPMSTAGDIEYEVSTGTAARLAIGTAGQVLMTNSSATAPAWTSIKFTPTLCMQAGDNNTYYFTLYAMYPFTINGAYYQTTAGTISANIKIGTTSVTGLSALALTSTLTHTTATAANTVAVGNIVCCTFSANASATYPTITLDCTRTG